MVGCDKNIPDSQGLNKLCKVILVCAVLCAVCCLSDCVCQTLACAAGSQVSVRLVLLVPAALQHKEQALCWDRVLGREPSDCALTVHGPGGEANARRVRHC